MFKSSPFKASPVVHISFIATLQADVDHGPGKIQGWLFFLPRARVNLKLIFLLTTGLVKFTVECLLTKRARRRRHIFEKSQQNLSFQMVSIVKLNFKVGLFYYILLFEFILISFFDVCKNTQIKPKIHQNWNLAKIAHKREKFMK